MRVAIIAVAIAGSVAAAGAATVMALRPQPASGGRISPHESVAATVDGARVTIVYGRPSMRGRKIFGALVPFGRVWCPGADEATTLDSARVIHMGKLTIPPGPHTIWMLPEANRWTLVISTEPSGFHTMYSPSLDMGRVPLRVRTLATPVEELTFAIEPAPSGGGTIAMSWEKTEVSVDFTTSAAR
jgi:hypothetical protein